MIRTLDDLRALYAAPGERALRKQLAQLDVHGRRFVTLSPFCVIASAGAPDRLLDASPRGGSPGFVKVADPSTLLVPDSGGNNRLDTFENLLADARIGLLFMIPGVDETLRVNGIARLRDEAAFVDVFAQERQRPRLVIEVRIKEAYLHCPKAFMRSALWQTESWPPRTVLPSLNQMIHDQTRVTDAPEPLADMVARYRDQIAQELKPTP
ncbi:pyridoxamine 5'-phosphate oxidase family protein [Variovorax sp. J22P271]|uniref:MSMEG_1061 family FMN-dependent PPOX-type flavoprotein n=1 Tax=Variovorax davisae TaxID=3053515 RepID=UPI00257577F3|nr:MSMEG_1061 family FMN-dependent PPOX-type flavoprotein [Variovorax sp. J22P271]MDM0032557.1 pyridoxamine 5'-phosphate oxidase family protein [Variovorax sp. J22P271]